MTKKQEVLNEIKAFNQQGVGVTRATLCGSMGIPSNKLTPRVTELIASGEVTEEGFVRHEGRKRALLWSKAA